MDSRLDAEPGDNSPHGRSSSVVHNGRRAAPPGRSRDENRRSRNVAGATRISGAAESISPSAAGIRLVADIPLAAAQIPGTPSIARKLVSVWWIYDGAVAFRCD